MQSNRLFCYENIIPHRMWNMFGKASSTYWYRYTIEVMWSGSVMDLWVSYHLSEWFCSSIHPVLLWQSYIHLSATCLKIKHLFLLFTVTCQYFFLYMVWVPTRTGLGWLMYNQWIPSSLATSLCWWPWSLCRLVLQLTRAIIFRCTYAWSNLQLMSTFFYAWDVIDQCSRDLD